MSAEVARNQVRDAFATIGRERIRIGALLCVLFDSGEWRDISDARSWKAYVSEDEGIEWHAAVQYMQVARRFILELAVDDKIISRIARASMRALVEASKVVDQYNLEEVVILLETLPRAEAIVSFEEMSITDGERARIELRTAQRGIDGGTPAVARVMQTIRGLPLEQRTEVYALIGSRPPMKRLRPFGVKQHDHNF